MRTLVGHVVSMTHCSRHQAAFPPLFVRVCVRAHVGASAHIPQRVCVIHAFLRLKERSQQVPRLPPIAWHLFVDIPEACRGGAAAADTVTF